MPPLTRRPRLRLTPPPTGPSSRRTSRLRARARRSPRSLRRVTWIDQRAIRASTAFERDSAAHGPVRSMAAALLPSAAEAVHGATGATGAIARDPRNPVYRRGVSNMFSSDNERSTGRSGQVSPRVALVRPVRGVPGVAAHTGAGRHGRRDDRRTSNGRMRFAQPNQYRTSASQMEWVGAAIAGGAVEPGGVPRWSRDGSDGARRSSSNGASPPHGAGPDVAAGGARPAPLSTAGANRSSIIRGASASRVNGG